MIMDEAINTLQKQAYSVTFSAARRSFSTWRMTSMLLVVPRLMCAVTRAGSETVFRQGVQVIDRN